MTLAKHFALALLLGLLSFLGVLAIDSFAFRLEPGSFGWSRLVRGVGPKGRLEGRAVVRMPGISRHSPPRVLLRVAPTKGRRTTLGVSVDGGPVHRFQSDSTGAVILTLPEARAPGARLDILRLEGNRPLQVRSIAVTPTASPSWSSALIAFGLAGSLTLVLLVWREAVVASALGLFTAGLLTLSHSPALVFLLFPDRASLPRVLIMAGFLLGSLLIALRLKPSNQTFYWRAVGVLIALVFGIWVRLYFLPSAGSWDMEYWKAWTARSTSHGITRVYGDPDAVPRAHYLRQLRGEEPVWQVESGGRRFMIDYPPLAIVAWQLSWKLIQFLPLDHHNQAEAQNVAAKLPAVAGDVAMVVILLWLFRDRPRRAFALAGLFWALPISWLSSAVLGYQDETYAPFAVAAVIGAGRARVVSAGVLLAAASMLKLLGMIATPTVAVALFTSRARLWKAIAGGLGLTIIVLLPFVLEGTLPALTVQLFRQLLPGNASSGYPNPWWIYGHLVNTISGATESMTGPVSYLKLVDLPFAAARIGTIAFVLAVVWVSWRQYRTAGVHPAALAGAAVFFAYAILSVGVFENHPHLAFPLLFATGLWSRRLQVLCGVAMASFILNLLLLSGLGRFYGTRYMALEPFVHWLSGLRMAAGFDLTLVLAVVNTVVVIVLFAVLPRELGGLERFERGPSAGRRIEKGRGGSYDPLPTQQSRKGMSACRLNSKRSKTYGPSTN